MANIQYKCPNCGSKEIQGKAWVFLNDLCKDISSGVIDSTDEEDYYCVNCGEHHMPILETDDKNFYELLGGDTNSNVKLVKELK